jgi:hypothetical protein
VPSVRVIDHLRARVQGLEGEALYAQKLVELELDLAIVAAVGDARALRPLVARRYGTGCESVPTPSGPRSLHEHARALVEAAASREEPPLLPAQAQGGAPSLAQWMLQLAQLAGLDVLDVQVRVEPNLTAAAATGDRTIFIAQRMFGVREGLRLAVHEVLGHLTAAENGRLQPLRIVLWGTADSFADQEGVALCLEQHFGFLDGKRLRSLGGRVLATAAMHDGAAFGETARSLQR